MMSDVLVAASTAGDGDTVTRLLQEGVSVNSKKRNGNMTGLHISAISVQKAMKILSSCFLIMRLMSTSEDSKT